MQNILSMQLSVGILIIMKELHCKKIFSRIYVTEGNSAISDHTLRSAASQCLAAFGIYLLKFTVGSFFGITAIIIAELDKKNPEIPISLSELTWFGNSCFMTPIGFLITGFLAQNLGPRRCLIMSSALFVISWITFHFTTNSAMLLCAQAIAGITSPAALGPGTTYIVEITQPHLRSALMACANIFVIFGSFLTILFSNWLHWRTIVLIDLIPPILGFIAVYMIPDSPHWLASKGKFNEAKGALSWLRGWTTPENISHEFNSLKETYKTPHQNPAVHLTDSYKQTFKPYFHRSFYLPLVSIGCMFILHSCTGFSPMGAYRIIIFQNINAPVDSHVSASLFDIMRTVGALVCILSVRYTGKRKLIFISLIGAGLSYSTIATILILRKHSNYVDYGDIFNWIAYITVIVAIFFSSSGIDKMVFMYNAELFPTKFRNLGSGIGLFIYSICSSVMNKSYLYMEKAMSLSGVFFFFGISCFMSCMTFYYILPETEGKTLQEVGNHYQRTDNSKHEQASEKLLVTIKE